MGLLITQCFFCFCTHSALDGSPSEGCSLNMTNSSPSSFLVLKYLPFIRIHPVFVSRYFKTPIMRFAIPSSRRCPIHSNLMKFLKIRWKLWSLQACIYLGLKQLLILHISSACFPLLLSRRYHMMSLRPLCFLWYYGRNDWWENGSTKETEQSTCLIICLISLQLEKQGSMAKWERQTIHHRSLGLSPFVSSSLLLSSVP